MKQYTFGQSERSRARAQLYRLQTELDDLRECLGSDGDAQDPSTTTSWKARDLVRKRRQRETLFGAGLFFDPAWDILLELFVAHTMQQRLAVSELGVAAAIPPTTTLRWINQLEKTGLVAREPDPVDARRVFIALTEEALASMQSYFA